MYDLLLHLTFYFGETLVLFSLYVLLSHVGGWYKDLVLLDKHVGGYSVCQVILASPSCGQNYRLVED